MSNVVIVIVNKAGASSPFSDPYISLFGTCDGAAQNFNIASDGTCTPLSVGNGGSTVVRLSSILGGALKLDSALGIDAGRIYFTSKELTVSKEGIDPTKADYYYDWIEFSLNIGQHNQLVVNTTQVDQFGVPIALEVSPADPNFGATVGITLDRTTVIRKFQSQLPAAYQDCLLSVSPATTPPAYWRILSPNQAIINKPTSDLTTVFTQAIDDFFTHYSSNKLYLNSDLAYPYVGQVTTVSEKGIDGQIHDYPVLRFNFATNGPINPGVPTTPSSGNGPYHLYYPFFTTNNPTGHPSFDGNALLPPPHWWTESVIAGNKKAHLNDEETPAQMVFAGNGIFADTFWQLGIKNTNAPTEQAKVLGNLENQVNVAFNRGHAQSWITLTGNIAPSAENSPPYTSKVTLTGNYSDQNQPNTTANLVVGMQVISFSLNMPMTIQSIDSDTTLTVTAPKRILPLNPLYLTFANFYPDGGVWNAYAQFFHQNAISIEGRAYAISFDDQGGFSPTLTSNWSRTPSTLKVTIGAWEAGS
ncbi:MAG: beta-1,3-glucanase family protein [Flammeovirgaceae bacterium]